MALDSSIGWLLRVALECISYLITLNNLNWVCSAFRGSPRVVGAGRTLSHEVHASAETFLLLDPPFSYFLKIRLLLSYFSVYVFSVLYPLRLAVLRFSLLCLFDSFGLRTMQRVYFALVGTLFQVFRAQLL